MSPRTTLPGLRWTPPTSVTLEQFSAIEGRLVQNNIPFIIEPQTRYPNQRGEQRTMFVLDFSNNPIEFKAFKNEEELF